MKLADLNKQFAVCSHDYGVESIQIDNPSQIDAGGMECVYETSYTWSQLNDMAIDDEDISYVVDCIKSNGADDLEGDEKISVYDAAFERRGNSPEHVTIYIPSFWD